MGRRTDGLTGGLRNVCASMQQSTVKSQTNLFHENITSSSVTVGKTPAEKAFERISPVGLCRKLLVSLTENSNLKV